MYSATPVNLFLICGAIWQALAPNEKNSAGANDYFP